MTFYADMAAEAQTSMAEFGQIVTVTTSTASTYDPATGTAVRTTATQSVWGALIEYSNRDIDGTLIVRGDKKLLLSPMTTTSADVTAPKVDDTVTLADSSVWTIKAVDILSPAGIPVLYTLQLRG